MDKNPERIHDNSPGSAPALRSASDEGGKNERHPGKQNKKSTSPLLALLRSLVRRRTL